MRSKTWLPTYLGVVAGLLAAAPFAFGQVQTDVFKDDARLQKRVPIRAFGLTMTELCADLSRRTGVKFEADKTVAEDKVILSVSKHTLAETLSVLANHFGFDWKRSAVDGTSTYVLYQTAESVQRDAAGVKRTYEEAADRILDEQKTILAIAKLPPELQQQRAAEIETAFRQFPISNPAKIAKMFAELQAIRWKQERQRSMLEVELLAGLTRDEINHILQGKRLWYVWPNRLDARSLPEAGIRDYSASVKQENDLEDPHQIEFVFTHDDSLLPGISVHSLYNVKTKNGGTTRGGGGGSPAVDLTQMGDPSNELIDWQKTPELTEKISVEFKQDRRAVSQEPPHGFLPPSVDIYPDFSAALDLDFISDAYATNIEGNLKFDNLSRGEALTQIARTFRQTWRYSDGFVRMRSMIPAWQRWNEPPSSVLARFAKTSAIDGIGLDDLAEIAKLPWRQYWVAARLARHSSLSSLSRLMESSYSNSVLWAALTSEQRQRAYAEGLAYKDLPPEQQRAFVAACNDELSAPGLYSSLHSIPVPLAQFATAVLKVKKDSSVIYGYRTSTSLVASNEALPKAIDIIRSKAGGRLPTDVRRMESGWIKFEFTFSDRMPRIHRLEMPNKWLEVVQKADP